MQDNRFSCGPGVGKEAVCIEANRILDSCRDRDCYENVKVFLGECGREIIEHTSAIRVKSAYIKQANIALDPVQFNRGFYAVNIRFYINSKRMELESFLIDLGYTDVYGNPILYNVYFTTTGYNSNSTLFEVIQG